MELNSKCEKYHLHSKMNNVDPTTIAYYDPIIQYLWLWKIAWENDTLTV